MLSLFIFVILIFNAATHPYNVAPQTILVNNMELPVVRTNLSQKDVDFVAEYQYVDGDVVNVICINFFNQSRLTMEYEMVGVMSDKSITNDLSSSKMIGFKTKLHSGHSNSYMICTRMEADDYTKVMVKFVMRTHFNNIVFLKIDGIPIRPYLEKPKNIHYRIDYKYLSNKNIKVTCEVERKDVKFLLKKTIRKREELTPNKKAVVRFLKPENNKKFECATKYLNGTVAETLVIHFTAGKFPIEEFPLQMTLPSNGRVMELYNDYKLNVIYYEFEHGEILQLTCGQLPLPNLAGPVLYMELNSEQCGTNGCSVSKTLQLGRNDENTEIICYLKEREPYPYLKSYTLLREIRVVLRKRVLTTATITTATTAPISTLSNNYTAANPATSESSSCYYLEVAGLVVAIIILVALNMTLKKWCCVRSNAPIPAPRVDPATVYYENLLTVFQPANEREAAEMEVNYYEEIRTHKRLNIHSRN